MLKENLYMLSRIGVLLIHLGRKPLRDFLHWVLRVCLWRDCLKLMGDDPVHYWQHHSLVREP